MIPTYNCVHYLRRTLESVLSQDPGPEEMQIEVVDNCSTKDDPEALVKDLGKGRVGFHRNPSNLGATRNFNTCIRRSHGQWVHILHGDDIVLPGFYSAYRPLASDPAAVMIMGRHLVIDPNDCWLAVGGPFPAEGSVFIPDFGVRQGRQQLGHCAAVAVRRSAYEQVGGFCTYFDHVTDWDMWFRVGQTGTVAGTTRPYAAYRAHPDSETSRLLVSGANIREIVLLLQVNMRRLGPSLLSDKMIREVLRQFADCADKTARLMDARGSAEWRFNQADWAWKLAPSLRRFLMLMKSWIKLKRARKAGDGRPVLSTARLPGLSESV
jgi:GT2 family glycosyltransferase